MIEHEGHHLVAAHRGTARHQLLTLGKQASALDRVASHLGHPASGVFIPMTGDAPDQRRAGLGVTGSQEVVGEQGRLSNPRDAFATVMGLLSAMLGRPLPPHRTDWVVQHQRRLTDDEISDLVHRRHEGETIDSLADAFGIHRTTVMAHMARHRSKQTYPTDD